MSKLFLTMMPLLCLFLSGSSKAEVLAGFEDIAEVSASEIAIRFGGFVDRNIHDIQVVRIHYYTLDGEGKRIKASGALLIPLTNGPFTVISQQHGTIQSSGPAPSSYLYGSEVYGFGSLLASSGYVVAAPDYIGYGSSRNTPHPYEHAALLATACNDMLIAVREYAGKNNLALNNNLLLTGYSEGGFATLALHRYIESLPEYHFNLRGSAPSSGAYDKTGFAIYILSHDKELPYINYYLWVLDTYNKHYKINRPWSFYLKTPYDKAVTKSGPVFANVEKNPLKLFTDQFREGIIKGTDKEFINALEQNTLIHWAPKAPVLLIHGTADDFVPYFNTAHALERMKALGGNVYIREIDGGDHSSSVSEYYRAVLDFVNDKK